MFPIIFCTIFTLVQMVQYISLLEVFTETRPWFQKHKVLVTILATANCILWAFVFDKYLYVKTVVAILSFFVITKVVVNVKNTVASALSMMYYNFMIIFEYCVIVLVAKIDLFRNVNEQWKPYVLQLQGTILVIIVYTAIIIFAKKNKGKLNETMRLLETKDWIGIFTIMFVSYCIIIIAVEKTDLAVTYHIDLLVALIGLSTVFMNVAIIRLFIQSVKRQKHILESEAILNRVKNETALYRSISDNLDRQRKRAHEFDNQLAAIKGMIEQGNIKELEEYVNLLEEKKPIEQATIDTKHVIVNAILNTKCEEMQSKDILFVSKINDLSELTIRDDDLVVLLSNLLNNAIEACEQSSDKIIKMKFEIEGNQIILSVKNSIVGLPTQVDGKIVTSKADHPEEHGIGLKNVEEVVEKYDGAYALKFDEGWFMISMMIPL
mgnify:CR=1 FL=1